MGIYYNGNLISPTMLVPYDYDSEWEKPQDWIDIRSGALPK